MRVMYENKNDMVNSITGYTYSIFFSGCTHRCDGCFSEETWDYNNGYDKDILDIKIDILKSRHKNISLLGGDPFYPKQRAEVLELITWVKDFTDKNIYVWTGYTVDKIVDWIDIEYIDYLIDGKFEKGKTQHNLILRGSSNQRVFHKGVEVTEKMYAK